MNIYVGNLSFNTSESRLREHFAVHGQVNSARIPTDKFTGKPRGFAFVEMASSEDGRAAIAALDGQELDGRALRVNEAQPKGEGQPAGARHGGRSGYGDARPSYSGARSSYGDGGSGW